MTTAAVDEKALDLGELGEALDEVVDGEPEVGAEREADDELEVESSSLAGVDGRDKFLHLSILGGVVLLEVGWLAALAYAATRAFLPG